MRQALLSAAVIMAAFVFATPAAAQIAPGFNGNCTGCTAAFGQNGWYCPSTSTCYTSGTGCQQACTGTTCAAYPQNCPVVPGEVPKYNSNCSGCTGGGGGSGGANAWYCGSTNICWDSPTYCSSNCNQNCFTEPYQCPGFQTPAPTPAQTVAPTPSGQPIPAYNGNCVGCSGTPGANAWYCPLTATCWTTNQCGGQCPVNQCIGSPASCPVTNAPGTNAPSGTAVPSGEIPAFNGNCNQCTSTTAGNGFYCTTSGLCWASKDECSTTCGTGCVAYTYQC